MNPQKEQLNKSAAKRVAVESLEWGENETDILVERLEDFFVIHGFAPDTRDKALGAVAVQDGGWPNLQAILMTIDDDPYEEIADTLFENVDRVYKW